MSVAHYPNLPTQCLKNKTILITGAGSGIGRAVALDAARAGATVLLLGRTEIKLETVYDTIQQMGGPKPAILPFDLLKATPDQCLQLMQLIEKEFGRLDGLLHNAAHLGQRTALAHYPAHVWLEVMQVIVNAPFLLTQSLLPLLRKSKHASVLFTTANVAEQPSAYWGAYGVAKSAVLTMMKILAHECEDNTFIRVNAINPVAAFTQLHTGVFPGNNSIPNPKQLTHSYLYLLSDYHRTSGEHFEAYVDTMETLKVTVTS